MTDIQEYTIQRKRTLLQMLAWGIFICTSAYFTGHSWRIPGLILGIVSSVVYFLLLWYRVLKSSDMPIYKAVSYMRVGWMIRLLFIVMMLLLSLKIPGLDFSSVVVGLFTLQIVMAYNAFLFVVKNFFCTD